MQRSWAFVGVREKGRGAGGRLGVHFLVAPYVADKVF